MSQRSCAMGRMLNDETKLKLRQLPSVDELVRSAPSQDAIPHWAIVRAARGLIGELRSALLQDPSLSAHIDAVALMARAEHERRSTLREVLNASGVVIHTNLGRAPLADRALERMRGLAAGYSSLEYDIERGQRGSRHVHAAGLLCELTGAEDAAIVNNNAAAVLLCLAAHARDREVIVSRGELIEIGGSFRIPDVMTLSGAELVEVGTTNRTHPDDYARAIGERTALLLKVHPSNYAIVGFTREVDGEELVQLGRQHGVMTLFDLGSGALEQLAVFRGQSPEPTVQQALRAGFDLVTFSGDKLVGGPQAGVILGSRAAIAKVRSHPLMRALRPDKLCLGALEATLELYREGCTATELPVIRMLSASPAELERRARDLRTSIALPAPFETKVLEVSSRAGGGAYPIADVPSWAVSITHPELGANALEKRLRAADPPVIARIVNDTLILDVLTLEGPSLAKLTKAVQTVFGLEAPPRDVTGRG